VTNALEKLGVPRSDMEVSPRWWNDPRVPNYGDGREAQNRRVEISTK
jgi:hypothetical protein